MTEANDITTDTTTWLEQQMRTGTFATEPYFAATSRTKASVYMADLLAMQVPVTEIHFLGTAEEVASKKQKYIVGVVAQAAEQAKVLAEAAAAAAAAATAAANAAAAAAANAAAVQQAATATAATATTAAAVQQAASAAAVQHVVAAGSGAAAAAAETSPATAASPPQRALLCDSFQNGYEKDFKDTSISHKADMSGAIADKDERKDIVKFKQVPGEWKAVVQQQLHDFLLDDDHTDALSFLLTSDTCNFEVQLGRMLKKFADTFIGTILQPLGETLADHGYAAKSSFGSLYTGGKQEDQVSACFRFTNSDEEHLIIVPQKEPGCPKNRMHIESDARTRKQNVAFFDSHHKKAKKQKLTDPQALLLQALRETNRAEAKSLGIV